MDAEQGDFERQPYDAKVAAMGAAEYEAYRIGVVPWQDPALSAEQRPFFEAEAQRTAARRLLEPEWFEARDILDRIVSVLHNLLGWPSRWTGEVEIEESLFHAGVAHLDGRIGIAADAWKDPAYRWRTLLHEALHTFSPSYSIAQYRALLGWEEGLIEQNQRLLRSQVFGALGVRIPKEAIAKIEQQHSYNRFIITLEGLREQLSLPAADFYRLLLRTPLPDRLIALREMGRTLPGEEQSRFTFALTVAHGQLVRPNHGT